MTNNTSIGHNNVAAFLRRILYGHLESLGLLVEVCHIALDKLSKCRSFSVSFMYTNRMLVTTPRAQ